MDSVRETLRGFIRQQFLFGRSEVDVTDDMPLVQNGIVDSVGILQLVGFLERTFDIAIRPEDLVLSNFESISAMVRLIESSRQ